MKRYGTTPNRLSNATQKKVVRTGNNTKRIGIIIAMAIVMVIVITVMIRVVINKKMSLSSNQQILNQL
mgnify:CR=1 FL=1